MAGNVGVRGQGCQWPSNPGLPPSWESPDPCLTQVLLEPPGSCCAGLALGCAPEPPSPLPSPGTTAALLLDNNNFRVIPWVPVAGPTPVLDRPSQPPGLALRDGAGPQFSWNGQYPATLVTCVLHVRRWGRCVTMRHHQNACPPLPTMSQARAEFL